MSHIFGLYCGKTYWKPHPYLGQNGWYELPLNWFVRSVNGQIEASPNADFSSEVYQTRLDYDGTMVIQNLLVFNALNPAQQLKIR